MTTRRQFLLNSSVLLGAVPLSQNVWASSPLTLAKAKVLKVGLVGCGGRGTGAIFQAMDADPAVEVVALADVFEDNLENAYAALKEKYGDRVKVDAKRKYLGFEAYKKLIHSDVDVVLLCSPPNFRPEHLSEAVSAGKHIFCEKPVAVDIPGIHQVNEAVRIAKEKKLCLVSGFCFRYSFPNREVIQRLRNGDIGEVKAITTFRHGGELTYKEPQAGASTLSHQLRNWFYFQRYSGDIIVEQTVHSVDFMSWVMNNELPVRVSAVGGRQSRPWNNFGNVFDHFAVEFEYKDGLKGFHFGRQQNGTTPRNTVEVMGSKGRIDVNINSSYKVIGEKNWENKERLNNMYQTQHNELFQAIRNKEIINDGDFMSTSTLLAIWAKVAAYTGKAISYEEIMKSQESLGPASAAYSWDMQADELPIARPGHHKFV